MNIVHVCDYSAPYKGNFIESLEFLEEKLKNRAVRRFTCFPTEPKQAELCSGLMKCAVRARLFTSRESRFRVM